MGADEPLVQELLDRLADQRLVRRVEDSGAYELAHDVLAASISAWIGEGERQLKQVRELLRRELADWQQDPGLLLSESKLQRVGTVRDELRTTPEETAFLARAAVTYGVDAAYWLKRLPDDASRSDLLLKLLDSGEPSARLHAAQQLPACGGDAAATALAGRALEDADASVRDAAALSLGRMGNAAGLRRLLDSGLLDRGAPRTRAVHALALAEDAVPGAVLPAAGPLRNRVAGEVLRVRLARDWPDVRRVTVGGAMGGALGFALAVAPAIAVHYVRLTGSLDPDHPGVRVHRLRIFGPDLRRGPGIRTARRRSRSRTPGPPALPAFGVQWSSAA